MHSNERCLAAPRALYTRPSPPVLTTSRLAAPCCPNLASNSQRCCTGHWDTQWGAHSSDLLCCSRPSSMKCFPRCHLCLPAGMRLGNLDAACVIWPVGDPVVGFLHPLSVSMKVLEVPFHFRPRKRFANSNSNFIPVSLVEKINCIKQCD